MPRNELLVDVLHRNLGMIEMTVADFSEADMLVRPVPGANHAAWQLGHLLVSESMMVSSCTPGAGGAIPTGWADRFSSKSATIDDPSKLATKAELLATFKTVRAATCAWAASLSETDLAKPAPENMRDFFPTVGHVLCLLPQHSMMHVGQFQVIRRKLGKPVLF